MLLSVLSKIASILRRVGDEELPVVLNFQHREKQATKSSAAAELTPDSTFTTPFPLH